MNRIVGREKCIVGVVERKLMVGRRFWCLKAGERHREVVNVLEIV